MNLPAATKRHSIADTKPGAPDARALWHVAPSSARLLPQALPAPAAGEMLVRTLWSAVSRGTERLVHQGLTAPEHRDHMRAPMQEGDFPFPVKYGYCAVGRVEIGPEESVGRLVFALHPHQDAFILPAADAVPVPDTVPARRATLAANMETALNALWDSGAGAGDRIVVVGAGLIGLLITYLAARLPGAEVTALDPNIARRPLAERFGARFTDDPTAVGEADVVFHASATSQGLRTALACCGTEASLVEVSWYGDEDVTVGLGGPFHCKRLKLISSQVGALPPSRRPRWTRRRRLEKALALLADDALDALITGEVAFDDLPHALDRIFTGAPDEVATLVRYPA
ncbi:zinc-dependent alcohol dehydrogenase [Aquabacter cavernae]|uniref:zinc-dependent alcohol dehydrogenase n=1 Tax=Aquabacter cavernae TaxID=2496029 RepID=UPI000F8EAD49|nr:zinc-binding alcohol dehydrogenase [Aquabacter cavernae]